MAKFDGIRGQELLEVEDKSEKENEITLIFKDNRYLFIKLENGKIVTTSIPELLPVYVLVVQADGYFLRLGLDGTRPCSSDFFYCIPCRGLLVLDKVACKYSAGSSYPRGAVNHDGFIALNAFVDELDCEVNLVHVGRGKILGGHVKVFDILNPFLWKRCLRHRDD